MSRGAGYPDPSARQERVALEVAAFAVASGLVLTHVTRPGPPAGQAATGTSEYDAATARAWFAISTHSASGPTTCASVP